MSKKGLLPAQLSRRSCSLVVNGVFLTNKAEKLRCREVTITMWAVG